MLTEVKLNILRNQKIVKFIRGIKYNHDHIMLFIIVYFMPLPLTSPVKSVFIPNTHNSFCLVKKCLRLVNATVSCLHRTVKFPRSCGRATVQLFAVYFTTATHVITTYSKYKRHERLCDWLRTVSIKSPSSNRLVTRSQTMAAMLYPRGTGGCSEPRLSSVGSKWWGSRA